MIRSIKLLTLACVLSCTPKNMERASSPPTTTTPAGPTTPGANAPHPDTPLSQVALGFSGRLERAVTSFGAAATDTHLYVLGGFFGAPHHYVREHQSDRFARMDLQTLQWETLPSVGRNQSATLSERRGRLYRVGGMRINNAEGQATQMISTDEFYVYDPGTATWQALTPLPQARSSHEATFVGDKLYVVGGWQLAGDAQTGKWATTILEANVTEQPVVWKEIPAPFKARAMGVASVGDELYAIGGLVGHAVRESVFIYDTRKGTWAQGPAFPEAGFGVRAATIDGVLLASGSGGTVFRISPDGSSWERVERLVFPRFFHQLVPVAERSVLFVGGIPEGRGADRISHIERLDIHAAPQRRVQSWTIETPSRAKNRQGLVLEGNRLYAFGGNNSLGQHDFAPDNFLNEAFRLDLGSFAWTPLPDFPRSRQSMQTLVSSDEKALAVGGFGMQDGTLMTHGEVFEFDFGKESWQLQPKGLEQPRTQFGLAEHGGRLWLFGGLNFDDQKAGAERFVHPLQVLVKEIGLAEGGFIDSGVALPRPRRAFAGAMVGGSYYLVGGMEKDFALVEVCDVFDFATKTWRTIPSPPSLRIGAEAVSLNDKLYLVGGRSRSEPGGNLQANNSIAVYDPSTQRWSTVLDELPMQDTHQLRAFAYNGRILIYTAQRKDNQVQLLLVDPS